jgi:hypothetical protein
VFNLHLFQQCETFNLQICYQSCQNRTGRSNLEPELHPFRSGLETGQLTTGEKSLEPEKTGKPGGPGCSAVLFFYKKKVKMTLSCLFIFLRIKSKVSQKYRKKKKKTEV